MGIYRLKLGSIKRTTIFKEKEISHIRENIIKIPKERISLEVKITYTFGCVTF